MIVRAISVAVKKESIGDFIQATAANHRGSLQEPGVLRFDVLQSSENPEVFLLYEAYTGEDAASAHKETAHYKAWKAAVEPMMAGPRGSTAYIPVAPADPAGWRS